MKYFKIFFGVICFVLLSACANPIMERTQEQGMVWDYLYNQLKEGVLRTADSLKYAQRYDVAAPEWERALAAGGLTPQMERYALNQHALGLLTMRRDAEAGAILQRLTKLLPSIQTDTAAWADFQFNQGLLAMRQLRGGAAKSAFEQALRTYDWVYPGEHLRKAQCLAHLANWHLEFGLVFDSTCAASHRADMAFRRPAFKPYAKEMLLTQAVTARNTRNPSLAQGFCEQALRLAQAKAVWTDSLFIALCESTKGTLYSDQMNQQDSALRHFRSAIEIGWRHPNDYLLQHFYQCLLIHYAQDTALKDKRPFSDSLNVLRKVVADQGRDVYASLERVQGYWAFQHGDLPEMVAQYEQVLSKLDKDHPRYWRLNDETQYCLQMAYQGLGQYEKALHHQIELYKAGTPLEGTPLTEADIVRPEIYRQITNQFVCFNQIAELYLDRYERSPDRPLEYLHKAIRFFDLTDTTMTEALLQKDESQVLVFEDQVGHGNYTSALRAAHLLCESGDPKGFDLAFRYIERQKSLMLFQSLTRDAVGGNAAWFGWVDSLRAVRQDIEYWEWAKNRNIPEAAERYSTAVQRRQALLRSGQAAFPDLFDATQQQRIPSADAVVAGLKDGEVLLQFSLSRKNNLWHGLLLCKKGRRFVEYPLDTALQNNIKDYWRTLSNGKGLLWATKSRYVHSARFLYDRLIKPFEGLLPTQEGQLTIIPDGILHILPFDALLTHDMPATSEYYKNAPYLLRRCPIFLSPSWKVWQQNPPTGAPIRRVASFSYGDSDSPHALLGWEQELEVLDRYFRVSSHRGHFCTAQRFLKTFPEAEALHLSLHGQSIVGDRRANQLYFALKDVQLLDTLYGFQLSAKTTKARLAVLSACQTALGDYQATEGAYTLARCFLQAGTAEVVSTFWSMDNATAIQLMPLFYDHLSKTNRAGEALHRAKLEYLQKASSDECFPGYWSVLCVLN